MKLHTIATLLAGAALLTACGGGDSTPPPAASVSSFTPETLMYGKAVKFNVVGQNLDQGVKLVSASCSSITEVTGGTATQRSFTCTPSATGSIPLSIQTTAGTALSAINPVVPVPQVTMKTTLGDIVLELYPNNAPITVNNFLKYVSADFYSNLIFHRIAKNFVIQGGGFNAALQQQTATNPAIKLEVPNGLSNLRGTVAMARTSVLDSATSQFFINTVDNVFLDTSGGGYAVFGKVVTGLSVADQIAAVPTQTVGALTDVPVTPVVINSMKQTQ